MKRSFRDVRLPRAELHPLKAPGLQNYRPTGSTLVSAPRTSLSGGHWRDQGTGFLNEFFAFRQRETTSWAYCFVKSGPKSLEIPLSGLKAICFAYASLVMSSIFGECPVTRFYDTENNEEPVVRVALHRPHRAR